MWDRRKLNKCNRIHIGVYKYDKHTTYNYLLPFNTHTSSMTFYFKNGNCITFRIL